MPPYKRNYYQGTSQGADGVNLPMKIRCSGCGKNLMAARFSNKQLNDYKERIYTKGATVAKPPSCVTCVGVVRTELTCSWCDKTKALELFSKVQRRNPDNARCLDCQQEVDDQVPDIEAALDEEKIKEEVRNSELVGSSTSSRMGSSAPSYTGSGVGRRSSSQSTVSHHEEDADQDGVWGLSQLSVGEHGREGSGGRSRAESVMSEESEVSELSQTTTNTQSTWNGFRPVDATYRNRIATTSTHGSSSRSASGNPGFYKQGKPQQDPVTKVMAQMSRQNNRAKDEALAPQRDQDSDDDDEEWEL